MARTALALVLLAASAALPAGEGAAAVAVSAGKRVDVHSSAITLADGRLLVVFESIAIRPGLWSALSADAGVTWSLPTEVFSSQLYPERRGFSHPSLARLADGRVLLVCHDASQQVLGPRIGLATSPTGDVFTLASTGLVLGWSDGAQTHPHLVAHGDDDLTLVYQRADGVYLARSNDAGSHWDTLRTQMAGNARKPRITRRAVDGLYLVAYEAGDGQSILVRRSVDPYDWSAPAIALVQGAASRDATPAVLADGALLVVYAMATGAYYDIYSRRWSPGAGWAAPRLHVAGPLDDYQPSALPGIHPDRVQLFWSHGRVFPPLNYTHVFTKPSLAGADAVFADGFES